MDEVLRAAALATAVLFGATATAADLQVPQEYPTIQSAVDAAASGDRILLAPGSYVETVVIDDQQLVLEGSEGAASTELAGAGDGEAAFLITLSGAAADLEVRGLTVTGGFGEAGSFGAGPGGGVLVDGASLTVRDSRFVGNAGITGGAIQVVEGSLAVHDSIFEGNEALHGGAVYLEFSSASIQDSAFAANEATNFGGAVAAFQGDIQMTDTELAGNTADQFGGAVYAQHAAVDLERLLAVGNGRAEQGEHGGWIIQTSGGGAVYTTGSSGRLRDSRILDNVAAAGSGVYIAGDGELELINNLLAGNGADCNCGQGAVYANASSPTLINNTIADNGGVLGLFTTYNAFPTVRNTIVAGRSGGSEVFAPIGGNGLSDVDFSLLQGESGGVDLGDNVMVVEDFPQLDTENDYAPLEESLAIDAGLNDALPGDITTDLLGNPRIAEANGSGGLIDLGAIEFQSSQPTPDRISHQDFMNH